MDFDADYRFALDCLVNDQYRPCDAIRSQLVQLNAIRSGSGIDAAVYIQRQRELLDQYGWEADGDGPNSFINVALELATAGKETSRPCRVSEWSSSLRRKLDEGCSPDELLRLARPDIGGLIEVASQFRQANAQRLVPVQLPAANKLVQFIQKRIDDQDRKEAPAAAKPNGSPTRVSGLFKKGFKRNLVRSQSSQSSSTIGDSQDSQPDTERDPKRSFMTGLEKHLVDQVMNNELDGNQARQILSEVRQGNQTKVAAAVTGAYGTSSQPLTGIMADERLKGIEPEMVELIQNEIVTMLAPTDWSHIAGLEYAKSKIQQVAILPLKRPDLFTGIRSPPKGILLFGPPGTGKTMIGRCIASQANATFFSITSSTLTSKWVGDGEKRMKTLFSVARCLKPSVIFIDEVDSLLKSRADTDHECSRRMKTEFLAQFDGLNNQNNDGLLVIATTNRPQELDEAVRRRFAAKLYIPLPEVAARRQIILNNLTNERHCLTDAEVDEIAQRTDGYSGSDVKNLCSEAAMYSYTEIIDRLAEVNKDDIRDINMADFEQALGTVKPSFSKADLVAFEMWNKTYGSEGKQAA